MPKESFFTKHPPHKTTKKKILRIHVYKHGIIRCAQAPYRAIKIPYIGKSAYPALFSKRVNVDIRGKIEFSHSKTEDLDGLCVKGKFFHPTMKKTECRVGLIDDLSEDEEFHTGQRITVFPPWGVWYDRWHSYNHSRGGFVAKKGRIYIILHIITWRS